MYKFFKDYFNFSHQEEGYSFPKANGLTKVSKKERIVWLIVSYIIMPLSFIVFLIPLSWYQNLYLWIVVIIIPICVIFNFDFRIFKIIRLYRYSKSKNVNKRIIYTGYMIDDYHKLCLDIFNNYKKKRINITSSSFKYRMDCFCKNIKLSISVKPRVVIIKINDSREIIKHNKDDFDTLLKIVSKKINSYVSKELKAV